MPSHNTSSNLIQVFESTVQQRRGKPCFRFVKDGVWQTLSWFDVRERVVWLAGALRHVGVGPGDRVGILSKTRMEWSLADLGILACGAASVPLHDSSSVAQIKHIILHADLHVLFVENDSLFQKIARIQHEIPHSIQVICFDPISNIAGQCQARSLEQFYSLNKGKSESVYNESLRNMNPSTLASLVYTSGTTGEPKGVELNHAHFMAEMEAAVASFKLEPEFVTLVFLPFAHILGRVAQFFHIYTGYVQCFVESLDKMTDNMRDTRPYFMVSVPRLLEKVHASILNAANNLKPWRKKLFDWSLTVGLEVAQKKLQKSSLPVVLQIKNQLAQLFVFRKIRNKMGGRLDFFVCGGAPLAADVGLFFYACGIKILEGYGLTETTAAIAVNRHEHIKFGTVGPAIGSTQFKIADDGEILAKGPMVFHRYYQDEQATLESFDSEGWFKTGDIGEIDADGFVTITDRKKDIIVTAGGKNIAPQHIENVMKSDPFISQCLVHGDRRKFLSALFTLDREQVFKYADEHKIQYKDFADLVTTPRIYQLIQERIAERNKHLASFETIKKFAILPTEFSVEAGDLTVSMKPRRKEITQKHAQVFDDFYRE